MKKNRGQSLVEFAVLSVLAIAIILLGLYQYGDDLANFFAGNDPGRKFNDARTVKFENPKDLLSNVNVSFDGINIDPPVEKVMRDNLTAGTYIQTSGSAGRIAEMTKIMQEYITQLTNIATTGDEAKKQDFLDSLDNYGESLSNGSGTGVIDLHESYSENELLKKKLNLAKMIVNMKKTSVLSDIKTAADNYVPTLAAGNRKTIVETFVSDLIGFQDSFNYFLDPSLYMKYLEEEKNNTKEQDVVLINAIKDKISELSDDEKLHQAGLIKVYYSGGYSQASPYAYNGERMCNTFGGTMISDTECEIPTP